MDLFQTNTESLLHYTDKRLGIVLFIATLLHIYVLFTIDIGPIIQNFVQKFESKQLAVELVFEEDQKPQEAQYIGLVNHVGPKEGIERVIDNFNLQSGQTSYMQDNQVISIMDSDESQPSPSKTQENRATTPQVNKPLLRRKIISAATYQQDDAAYLYRWQQYIESIGNELYPKPAMANNITGKLLLLVALNPDGSIREAKIRQSSGHELLDQAAMKIVQTAQPFEKIPNKMLQDNDVIEIIRTWDFRGRFESG